jgi:hypothetical protein
MVQHLLYEKGVMVWYREMACVCVAMSWVVTPCTVRTRSRDGCLTLRKSSRRSHVETTSPVPSVGGHRWTRSRVGPEVPLDAEEDGHDDDRHWTL